MKHLTVPDANTVRGILAGAITHWWQPIKHQPHIAANGSLHQGKFSYGQHLDGSPALENFARKRSPYQQGAKLYLREAWCPVSRNYRRCKGNPTGRMYEADGKLIQWPWMKRGFFTDKVTIGWYTSEAYAGKPFRWRPAHSMPEWARRCTLEVTNVRVRRVQDVEPELARIAVDAGVIPEAFIMGRADYWNSLFPRTPYSSNPWTWFIEFRRVQ